MMVKVAFDFLYEESSELKMKREQEREREKTHINITNNRKLEN